MIDFIVMILLQRWRNNAIGKHWLAYTDKIVPMSAARP